MKLLHYGLQRSGTNFLETLVRKRYRVRFENEVADRRSPLQKHFRLYDQKDIIPEPQYKNDINISSFYDFEQLFKTPPDYYLVISKDPYSWLISYMNWGKKCNWPAVQHHYIEEYNLFYGKWLEFSRQSERIIFVRYIDLLRNEDEFLGRLEASMFLKKKLLYPVVSSLVNKVPQSRKFTNERRVYYLTEQYLNSYSQEDMQQVNDLVDPEVISLLGYEKKEIPRGP